MASARARFDVIVLDTAPLLTTNDATEVMSSVDLVVLTCRSGTTTADSAKRARELLARIAAPTSGVILLGSEASTNDCCYYYSRSRAKPLAKGSGYAPGERQTTATTSRSVRTRRPRPHPKQPRATAGTPPDDPDDRPALPAARAP